LIDAMGLRREYLQTRGISPAPKPKKDARKLTPDEITQALALLKKTRGKATVMDVAWALGISDMTLYDLRRRHS
jgi:hypothetical protein